MHIVFFGDQHLDSLGGAQVSMRLQREFLERVSVKPGKFGGFRIELFRLRCGTFPLLRFALLSGLLVTLVDLPVCKSLDECFVVAVEGCASRLSV